MTTVIPTTTFETQSHNSELDIEENEFHHAHATDDNESYILSEETPPTTNQKYKNQIRRVEGGGYKLMIGGKNNEPIEIVCYPTQLYSKHIRNAFSGKWYMDEKMGSLSENNLFKVKYSGNYSHNREEVEYLYYNTPEEFLRHWQIENPSESFQKSASLFYERNLQMSKTVFNNQNRQKSQPSFVYIK